MNLRTASDVVATAALIAAASLFVINMRGRPSNPRPPEAQLPAEPIKIGQSHKEGNASARVALVAFSDFTCTFCGKFASDTLPHLRQQYIYTGRVDFVYKQLPRRDIRAETLAIAAECAGAQGRFWQMHDLLFSKRVEIVDLSQRSLTASVGVQPAPFQKCVGSRSKVEIDADIAEARTLGIRATPSFFVGTIRGDAVYVSAVVVGAQPIGQFVAVIDRALKAS